MEPPNHSIYSLYRKRFCMTCLQDRPIAGGSFVSGQGVPKPGMVRKFVCARCIPGIPESLRARLGPTRR